MYNICLTLLKFTSSWKLPSKIRQAFFPSITSYRDLAGSGVGVVAGVVGGAVVGASEVMFTELVVPLEDEVVPLEEEVVID